MNLAEVFKQNEGPPQKPELEVVESQKSQFESQKSQFESQKSQFEAAPTDTKKIAPSRKSKKHIGGYFDEAVYRQMKHIGVEKGMTTQEILADALNGFFQRNDKPPIA